MLAVLLLNRMAAMATRHRMKQQEKPAKGGVLEPGASDDSYCRTCLGTENLLPIFSDERIVEKRSRELKITTGLQIKKNDGLSQRICAGCVESLNEALKFRRKSRKAEKVLLNRISAKKTSKKYPIKKQTKFELNIANFSFNNYDDGFQDEPDYEHKDNLKIKQEKGEVKVGRGKKKRVACPAPTSYKCTICSKEFRMKATYKAHMRFHTNYCVCESCGKRCRNNNQLQEHKRARHGLGRIHKCAYCEYSSATKEALTIHERRHTGERPYICDHCGATFHRRSNLVQHIAIHLPEKNFQCDMCPKRLKSKKFLQIHKHNAHTGKRYGYLCPICEHRFEKPNKVRAHTRRVHGLDESQHGPVVRVQL